MLGYDSGSLKQMALVCLWFGVGFKIGIKGSFSVGLGAGLRI